MSSTIEVVIDNKKYVIVKDYRYTKTDEWAKLEDENRVRIGITDYAQKELHDIIGIELPEKGAFVKKGDTLGSLESVKATSDYYSPVSGKIVEVNERLIDEPELLNTDPYGEGWIAVIEISDKTEYESLLSAEEYAELIKEKIKEQ